MLDRADRLERRSVSDIGSDRDGRRDAEEEDEGRRHQGPATHACRTYEDSREQSRDDELPRHVLRKNLSPGQRELRLRIV